MIKEDEETGSSDKRGRVNGKSQVGMTISLNIMKNLIPNLNKGRYGEKIYSN